MFKLMLDNLKLHHQHRIEITKKVNNLKSYHQIFGLNNKNVILSFNIFSSNRDIPTLIYKKKIEILQIKNLPLIPYT